MCDCTGRRCNYSDLLYERIALNDQNDSDLNITLVDDYTEACIWSNRKGNEIVI